MFGGFHNSTWKKTGKPIYKGIDKDNKKDLHIFLLTILFYWIGYS